MTGASSTWYAIDASFSVSRSSRARSESVVELIGAVDDCSRCFGLQLLAVVDAPPGDGDGVHVGRLGGPDVERRVADVCAVHRIDAHALGSDEQRLGIGLVALRLVAADDRLEEVADAQPREGEVDSRASLGGDDADAAAVLVQAHDDVLHAVA